MPKKMLIDATHAEETRVVVVDGNKVEEFDFESLNKRQLAGNIYLAKVTRVEPSLQAAFVEYGGNRHGFLAFSEIHPDYYQIPTADREALLAEEAEYEKRMQEEAEKSRSGQKSSSKSSSKSRSRSRSRSKAASDGAPSGRDAVKGQESGNLDDVTDIETEDETGLLEDLPENALKDVPPANAASGEVDIRVAEEPSDDDEAPVADDDGQTEDQADSEVEAGPDGEEDDVETLGAEAEKEEIVRRKPRLRKYKIQEVIKVRQILLVQVVKEERGNKGAALTTYLSLAGRYCVLMPNTARGGGISRKITNAADRKKLKEIAGEIMVPEGAGLIVRTAGAQRTKSEIKRDYEFLLRQWEQIKDLTMKSIAPAPIYEEGSLIKRTIRDLYSKEIDEIFVDGERGYREAKDYMKMLMPSHAKNVKLYADPQPLFSRYQVENYLSAMFNPTVQLKSGGYIVIDVTEALVAVDVNSGRATKEQSIEDTALKTNLEAAEEVARQARLRDLAGLIVIDFIDMDERKNNMAVERRLKDRLKNDRARIQVGRISNFGLLEMSRQRLRPGMLEATTAPCPHCHGTGRTRSADSLALAIMRELEEEGVRKRSREVLVTVPYQIANYLLNQKREHIAMIEARFGLSVRIEGDPALISPDYRLERFKTASRIVPEAEALNAVSASSVTLEDDEDEDGESPATAETSDGNDGEDQPRKRRRRRRRRSGRRGDEDGAPQESGDDRSGGSDKAQGASQKPADADTNRDATRSEAESGAETEAEDSNDRPAQKPRTRTRSSGKAKEAAASERDEGNEASDQATDKETAAQAEPAMQAAPAASAVSDAEPSSDPAPATAPQPEATSQPTRKPRVRASAQETIDKAKAAPAEVATDASAEPQDDAEAPKRRGWWSRAIGN